MAAARSSRPWGTLIGLAIQRAASSRAFKVRSIRACESLLGGAHDGGRGSSLPRSHLYAVRRLADTSALSGASPNVSSSASAARNGSSTACGPC
jgi:hypothetical protein